ncbi:MAG: hypothetical protein HYT62_03730 [Candidatus Yanofskybacteria bacterium]|nr:hypothetical protein [Candidatus Yanofskybacteria bacterium]
MNWNLRKTLKFFGIIAFAFAIAFLKSYLIKSDQVEASQIEKTGPRLQLQNVSRFGDTRPISVICDTATGTLLYVNGIDGGMWGNPNGCAKSRR